MQRVYYPNGIDLESIHNSEEAIKETNRLMMNHTVTIFEAAVSTGPFLVRIDVLEKIGNQINLFEVKKKSFCESEDHFFTKNGKTITSEWEEYLVDVAFPGLRLISFAFVLKRICCL